MKTLKNIRLSFKLALILIIGMTFSNCSEDDDLQQNYIGVWEMSGGLVKSEFIFTVDTYDYNAYSILDNEESYLYSSTSGNLKVTSENIELTMNKIKIDTSFFTNYTPSNILIEYDRGTDEFNNEFGSAIYNMKYEITGNTMKVWMDNRPVEYTKK